MEVDSIKNEISKVRPVSDARNPLPLRSIRRTDSSFSQHYVKDETTVGDCISLDHCYSKNWNSQSDDSHACTAKYVTWTDRTKRDPIKPNSR